MRRFYVSPMVQATGPGGHMVWAPKVAHQLRGRPNTAVSMVNPAEPAMGSWALVVVETPDHTGPAADIDNDALPDLTLDTTLSVLGPVQRNALLTKLGLRGVNTQGWGVNTPFRDVLRALGQVNFPGFSEDAFDAVL